MNNLGTSYVLWLACIFQFHGLHRFYNKKYASGILWFCTFGLFGIGQFVDLFLMRNLVDEHNALMQARLGATPQGIPLHQATTIAQTYQPPATPDQLKLGLIRAAAKRGGKLTVTQGVLDTNADFARVEQALMDLAKHGHVHIDNHPETGVVIYDFVEL